MTNEELREQLLISPKNGYKNLTAQQYHFDTINKSEQYKN